MAEQEKPQPTNEEVEAEREAAERAAESAESAIDEVDRLGEEENPKD